MIVLENELRQAVKEDDASESKKEIASKDEPKVEATTEEKKRDNA